jgi:hypothetical protein
MQSSSALPKASGELGKQLAEELLHLYLPPAAEDQKAAIDAEDAAALIAREAELKTKCQTDIEVAVESGRLEGTMKMRLKHTQLAHRTNADRGVEKSRKRPK